MPQTTSFVLSRRAVLLAAAGASALATPHLARADEGADGMTLFGNRRVAGSGRPATESRAVTGFQAIAVRTSMKLVLRQGAREGIELRGDDNLLPLIETAVVDRSGVPTLEIGARKGSSFSAREPIVATVDLLTLRALSISGSGEVTADGLKTPVLVVAVSGSGLVRLKQLAVDELSARISGSADLEFGGRANRFAIAISGSGNVKARGLEADDVTVNVGGSGDAAVTARKTLTVAIAGVGNVRYGGDAVVSSSIAGHGKISRE